MQDYIDVPGWFLNTHPEIFEEFEIEIMDPVGNLFEVKFCLNGKNPRYGGCFDQIRGTHDLKKSTYICFRRMDWMMYDIRIYNKDNSEVQYKHKNE